MPENQKISEQRSTCILDFFFSEGNDNDIEMSVKEQADAVTNGDISAPRAGRAELARRATLVNVAGPRAPLRPPARALCHPKYKLEPENA
ncbi:hypothetical protein EVAR_57824_1 [Eumeta japonica]|uniref:Uncharacterized protein n=1 Tax=Eumeta variegata TaxID=151549 RepID=A0A4C2A0T8_EUMVA|nr:hypothetical protein EVAR_57824_1 [Eumeta japonica]